MQSHYFTTTDETTAERLDRLLATLLPDFSRARLQGLIAAGHVLLNGQPCSKANTSVKTGTLICVNVPSALPATPAAQAMALDIIFEDDDVLVINKAAGLVVHPAAGHADATLVNALLAHCGDSLSGINGVRRPGIVHRLDKDTTGLMVVAKNDTAHQALAAQFADRSLSRTYLALVHGLPPAQGHVSTLIGRDPKNRQRQAVVSKNGKTAVTHFTRQQVFAPHAALLACELETGRTHQIRVHLQHLGYPLVGDPVYGKKRGLKNLPPALANFPRQALHASTISFKHPRTAKKLSFSSTLPDDMKQLLSALALPIL